MQRRCDRNRKRSKRRAIYCPIHSCYIDSVSQKYKMFADPSRSITTTRDESAECVDVNSEPNYSSYRRGMVRSFWCEECQQRTWYHIRKSDDHTYEISVAPQELWQQVTGVIDSLGNPSVGEFTRRSARYVGYQGLKAFQFVS